MHDTKREKPDHFFPVTGETHNLSLKLKVLAGTRSQIHRLENAYLLN